MLPTILSALLVVIVASAPIEKLSPDGAVQTPLHRVKRSEEVIFYGNHQNSARVKKADPAALEELAKEVQASADAGLDKKSTVEVKTAVAESKQEQSPDTSDGEKEHKYVVVEESKPDGANGVIKEAEVAEVDVDGKGNDDVIKEDFLEEELKKQTETEVTSNEDTEDKTEEAAANNDVEVGDGGSGEDSDQTLDNAVWDELYDYYYDYPNNDDRRKRSAAKGREKRSGMKKAVTAEDMMVGDANMRVKRDLDLDPEDIQYLFGNQVSDDSMPESMDELQDENQFTPEDIVRIMDTLPETEEEIEEEKAAEEADALEGPYPELGGEWDDQMSAAEDAALIKLQLLKYLYDAGYAGEEEGLEEEVGPFVESSEEYIRDTMEPFGEEPNSLENFQESWEDVDSSESQIEYEPIMYQGKLGIFIPMEGESNEVPVKRQYLSLVPGMRKRNFYPYANEPQSNWAGMVTGREEKRNQDRMYDRLYELADALRGRQEEDNLAYWQQK